MTTLAGVRGVLLDLDGTVYEDDALLPGAAEAVDALRATGLPVRFGTNTTRMSYQDVRRFIAGMGLEIADGDLFTAPVAAAHYLRSHGVARLALYLPAVTHPDFADFEITDDQPEAVVLGDLGAEWSWDRLNAAFRHLLDGAALIGLQRNRYWKTGGRLTLDAGPMLAALEYATGRRAVITGKPSPAFFQGAADSMGIAVTEMVVVGDDLRTDVRGSIECGARGVLVRTGKFRVEDLEQAEPAPTAVVDSIAALPELVAAGA